MGKTRDGSRLGRRRLREAGRPLSEGGAAEATSPTLHDLLYRDTVSVVDFALARVRVPTALPPIVERLRKIVVTDPLHADPRSTSNPLGLSREAAVQAIGWGQANFDEPLRTLSPEDRVMLYAYWNQKRHLEELSEAFRQMFTTGVPNHLIVIDLGCGPFTGGLALAGQLGADNRFDYIGVDRSRAMRHLGEQFAVATEHEQGGPKIERLWAEEMSGDRMAATTRLAARARHRVLPAGQRLPRRQSTRQGTGRASGQAQPWKDSARLYELVQGRPESQLPRVSGSVGTCSFPAVGQRRRQSRSRESDA